MKRAGVGAISEADLADYLARSGEHDMDLEKLRENMGLAMAEGGFWVDPDRGFMFGRIQEAEVGGKVGVVQGFYAKSADSAFVKEADTILGDWAREKGASSLAFFTRRSPSAFLRRLGKAWTLDSHVLRRAV